MYPTVSAAPNTILPERPREFLRQATESLAQPMGSIILSAGAVDAMLKAKGLKQGSLYSRTDKAADEHHIVLRAALR